MKRILIGLAAVGLLGVVWAQRRAQPEQPQRFAARGTRVAIGAGTDAAANAGMRLAYAGGNAVDAGVATMFAASIVEYSHFGFGGEAEAFELFGDVGGGLAMAFAAGVAAFEFIVGEELDVLPPKLAVIFGGERSYK